MACARRLCVAPRYNEELAMRLIWVTCIAVLFAGTAPATARDYPWCQRQPGSGGSIQCSFTTLEQCQAAASGIGGGCQQNPAMATAGQPPQEFERSSLRASPPGDGAPHRRPHRVRHAPGKHGWYYE
jgi:hypothetical protein